MIALTGSSDSSSALRSSAAASPLLRAACFDGPPPLACGFASRARSSLFTENHAVPATALIRITRENRRMTCSSPFGLADNHDACRDGDRLIAILAVDIHLENHQVLVVIMCNAGGVVGLLGWRNQQKNRRVRG